MKRSLPEFIIIYLPNDHTSGYNEQSPTPRAFVADNDWATGRVVEALSKSSFWKDMAIFINEDDPQSGTDHVDGHRSICMVAGPYVKRNAHISKFYNQSSVLHTICQIFGVQPMNQLVATAPLMTECFQEQPDYTAYNCLIPSIPINEMNPPKEAIKAKLPPGWHHLHNEWISLNRILSIKMLCYSASMYGLLFMVINLFPKNTSVHIKKA